MTQINGEDILVPVPSLCIQERPGKVSYANMKFRYLVQEIHQALTVMQHSGHEEAAVCIEEWKQYMLNPSGHDHNSLLISI